ncbi:MAG: ferrous iron transporter B [Clostridiales bacterium]|nr:ferrous iron transporter B [Clostridiales bacterium]
MRAALCGNPNSGKTTLLNRLTGMRQRTGNFPGVTVERVEGALRADPNVTLIDLPGVYALDAAEGEEALARESLRGDRPDAILNVLDATSLARGLYLTLELIATGIPVLVALTMLDELPEKGAEIDFAALARELGTAVIAASAGGEEVLAGLRKVAGTGTGEKKERDEAEPASGRKPGEARRGMSGKSSAASLRKTIASLPGCKNVKKTGNAQPRFPKLFSQAGGAGTSGSCRGRGGGAPPVTSLNPPPLYPRADEIFARTVRGAAETEARARSRRADAALMHPLLAWPAFAAVMAAILYLTFGPVGGTLGGLLSAAVERAFAGLDGLLTRVSAPEWIRSLLSEGVLNGLGSVLGFLPAVLTLFFLLSLVEDSGYMARMACCADRLLRRLGLNGRAFVPALLGFGCTVPAILATRTLPDARDRRRMTLLLPFCSCSAKLPVYSLFASAFFPGRETLAVGALYALGAAMMLPAALCMSRLSPGGESTFVMELPSYRMPSARAALSLMLTRSRIFVRCALTTLLPASLLIWLMNRVQLGGRSALETLAGAVAPLFLPAGFGNWQASAALLTGLAAKEAILSTFGVLLRAPGAFALRAALRRLFTPLSAASFLTFTLLYTPCAAAFGAARRELGSTKTALCAAGIQCLAAYLAACVVFNAGRLMGLQ